MKKKKKSSVKKQGFFVKFIIIVFIIALLLIGSVVGIFYKLFKTPNLISENKIVLVNRGENLSRISRDLEKQGIIRYSKLFLYTAKILKGRNIHIKSGEYIFETGITPERVLEKLMQGKVYYRKLTIAEGLSSHTILTILKNTNTLIGNVPENIVEGSLLPETYTYTRGESRKSVIKRMQKAMQEFLNSKWEKRDKSIPVKTKQEVLVLASIVERETGILGERGKVASVFVNRLRIGMRLQSDPTVVYAFTNGNKTLERSIRISDLQRKSPFNTYKIYGLPPTPIANPGKEAIQAVLNPSQTEYLFFVATGNGGHNFSKKLRDHINFVNSYKKVLKQKTKK